MFAQFLCGVINPSKVHTIIPVLMQAPNSDRTPTIRDKRSTTSCLIVVGNKPPPAASLHPDYLQSSCRKISGGLIAQVALLPNLARRSAQSKGETPSWDQGK